MDIQLNNSIIMNPVKLVLTTFTLVFLFGCTLFKPDSRDPVPVDFPLTYSLYPETTSVFQGKWWEDFQSTELNRLIGKAFESNFDLRKSYANLKQSRSLVKKQASYLFPEFSGNTGYSQTNAKGSDRMDTLSLGLAASYEIDFWGRIRSLKTSEILGMRASADDYLTMAMTVAAHVAEAWIDILATRQEIAYVKERINTNTELMAMLEKRFEKGMATSMDVLNQKEALSHSLSLLPSLEAQEQVLANNLSLLLGKPPGFRLEINRLSMPDLVPFPKAGLPSDLLAMRPDVRSAGLRLRAADWQISAAKAARLPSLSLSGSGTYSAEHVEDVFNHWIINLAANLTGPVFDAGRRKADVEKARAISEERLANYESTVFQALLDVENAMVHELKQKDYTRALSQELDVSKLSYKEATRRYLAGQDSYLLMQEKMLNIQNLEVTLIRQKAILFKYRIALYRSLGGNWALNPEDQTHTEPR